MCQKMQNHYNYSSPLVSSLKKEVEIIAQDSVYFLIAGVNLYAALSPK